MAIVQTNGPLAPGAKYGAPERCPHCGTLTTVEPSPALRYRCRVCGGPRVVIDDPAVERSGRVLVPLERAHRERVRIAAWGLGAALAAGFGAISLTVAVVALLLASPGPAATLAVLVMTLLPLLLAAVAWRRHRYHRAQRDAELGAAWSLAAADVLAQRGEELTAEQLGRIMHLQTPEVEQLMVLPQVHDEVRTRVTDAGELVYAAAPGPRVRIHAPAEEQARTEAEAASEVEQWQEQVPKRTRDHGA
jgi:hypothetical protein